MKRIPSNILDMHNDLVDIYHDEINAMYINDELVHELQIYGIKIADIINDASLSSMNGKQVTCLDNGVIQCSYNKDDTEGKFKAYSTLSMFLLYQIMECEYREQKTKSCLNKMMLLVEKAELIPTTKADFIKDLNNKK